MSIEEILVDVKKEGLDPFEALEKETPSDSPAVEEPKEVVKEDKPVEGDNTPEDNVPFHKHPRWIERENELNELKVKADEFEQFKQEIAEKSKPSDTKVPDWFVELYGDNEVAYRKYEEHEKARTEEIEARVIEKQEQARTQAVHESQKWNKWVEDEIGKLEAEGKQFDRNKFINTMLTYRPTDENNNFDFQAGYKIYEALELKEVDPAKSQARKQFADTATATSKGEKKAQDFQTPETLRNKSWHSL